jgi:hypothetical protein
MSESERDDDDEQMYTQYRCNRDTCPASRRVSQRKDTGPKVLDALVCHHHSTKACNMAN